MSATPMTEREEIARIIDPKAWETLDHLASLPNPYLDAAQRYVAESLAKADAILSRRPEGVADCTPSDCVAACRMADSNYIAGLKAGFSAASSEDPNAALERLITVRLNGVLEARAMLAARPKEAQAKDNSHD